MGDRVFVDSLRGVRTSRSFPGTVVSRCAAVKDTGGPEGQQAKSRANDLGLRPRAAHSMLLVDGCHETG
jgi:hypothetical protein